jgi:hypothetical protein
MPTIVYTMLVRVASMACWGRVASVSAGAATSGSGGSELSAGAGSGLWASGPSGLIADLGVAPL